MAYDSFAHVSVRGGYGRVVRPVLDPVVEAFFEQLQRLLVLALFGLHDAHVVVRATPFRRKDPQNSPASFRIAVKNLKDPALQCALRFFWFLNVFKGVCRIAKSNESPGLRVGVNPQ